MDAPPIGAYYRVWSSLGRTEKEHGKAHAELWADSDKPRVVQLLTSTVAASPAPEDDRVAVVQHLAEDWRTARVLASLAGSATCRSGTPLADRIRALREKAGLTVAALAAAAGIDRNAVYLLEAGDRRPTWDTVQALAKALGVPTDTFRDR